MPTGMLGNTGIKVSRLALGTVKLGRDQGVKYPTPVKIPNDREALALLAEARALGINLIDTAPAYGNSESRLGTLLAGQRQHWVICTKVGEEFEGGESNYNFSPEAVTASIHRSLARLQTNVLDIALIHSDGRDLDILQKFGTLEALTALKAAGKIRAVGISHKTVPGAELAIALGTDVLMATLNPTHTEETEVIAAAGGAGVGVLIKKALASGHGNAEDLKWVAAQPGVTSVVVGTTNPVHLAANVAALAS